MVDAAGRLVEEEDVGFVQQARRHRQSLLAPDRKDAAHRARFEVELLEDRLDPGMARLRESPGSGKELEVFPHGEIAVKRDLLRDIADPSARSARALRKFSPATSRWPLVAKQAAQHAECRRLARAVGSEQAEDFLARPRTTCWQRP
jgi:hypothetical protein